MQVVLMFNADFRMEVNGLKHKIMLLCSISACIGIMTGIICYRAFVGPASYAAYGPVLEEIPLTQRNQIQKAVSRPQSVKQEEYLYISYTQVQQARQARDQAQEGQTVFGPPSAEDMLLDVMFQIYMERFGYWNHSKVYLSADYTHCYVIDTKEDGTATKCRYKIHGAEYTLISKEPYTGTL